MTTQNEATPAIVDHDEIEFLDPLLPTNVDANVRFIDMTIEDEASIASKLPPTEAA